MNLLSMRTECRYRLGDKASPPFWTNEWLDSSYNEAERESCIRGRLITDVSSAITSLDLTTTEKRYELDSRIIDVLDCELEANPGVTITGWTLTESEIVFDDYPNANGVLLMTVIRLPLNDMSDDKDEPEIRSHHHVRLIDWILYRAYMVQDADTFNPVKAQEYLALFEQSFGRYQTANVQRKHREKHGRIVRMAEF